MNRPCFASAILAAFGSFLLAATSHAAGAAAVDFNRDIRPILAGNCLKCHGIDEGGRKSKLRLDVRETATAPAKSGKPAIVPGHPEASELVRRVTSSDPDVVMPPASTHVVLTDAQKQLLTQWVAQGAAYQTHWAFVAPRQVTPGAVRQADWVRNPIDRFVLAKLEAEGLHPSPEADRYTLIRRVYLDLIGLPPTPERADAFVHDARPDAYERLVDELLASPRYGERWARRWLDLARYADTNGFEKDRVRNIWPYRDWVINALNADMPFDEFTVEQLAGDMLPNATPQQKIATGFHRNTMLNEEGGIDPLEYRFLAEIDRNNTTGTAWLGLTVGCAQCHTHKYDPITQAEYYRLMAFLNNADEPLYEIPDPAVAARRAEIEAKVAKLKGELPDHFPVADSVDWARPALQVTTAAGSTPEPAEDGAWRFTGPSPDRDTYTLRFDTDAGSIDRVRLEVLKDGAGGPGRTHHGNFVLNEITAEVAPEDGSAPAKPLKFVRAEADFSQTNFGVDHAIDGNPATGWAVDPGNGTKISGHTATFYLQEPVKIPAGGARWTIKLDQQYGEQHTIARLRLSVGSPSEADGSVETRRRSAFEQAFNNWTRSAAQKAARWTVARPDEMASSKPYLALQPDGSILAGGDVVKSCAYDLTFHPDLNNVTAVRLEALPDDSLPDHGPGMVFYEGQLGDFFLSEVSLKAGDRDAKFTRAVQSFGSPASAAIDGDPQTGWSIAGGQGKPHVAIFALGDPADAGGGLKLRLLFERYFAAPLGHFRVSFTDDPNASAADPLPPEINDALLTPADRRSQAEKDRLRAYFCGVAPELAGARRPIEDLEQGEPRYTTTLVMRERPAGHGRPTFVHHRGEFLSPTDSVEPGVPAFLPQLPGGVPANRLSYARWLVSKDNPLTARVQVNRQWAAFFGRGIVRTLQDFGYQGELPSNQDLLDWLAVEFMHDGWSLKKLDRLIVTSATYRQDARVTPELLARDPDNALLARGPRFRLEAELIRDSALASAGLLSEKIGGPSVFPPQPASVTTEGAYGALPWNASTGEDRFRRSLYTFSKRTAPFALYNTFDAPTGEACVARRDLSNSPLQALSLMNDTVFVEAAQAVGRTYAGRQASDADKASAIFRRFEVRPPAADELDALVRFAAAQRQRLTAKELDPAKIAAGGEGDPTERAVWTIVARAVMNLDETITEQ